MIPFVLLYISSVIDWSAPVSFFICGDTKGALEVHRSFSALVFGMKKLSNSSNTLVDIHLVITPFIKRELHRKFLNNFSLSW